MDIRPFLETMVGHNASDIYLTVGTPPMYRIEGVAQSLGRDVLTPAMLEVAAHTIMKSVNGKNSMNKWR